MEYVKLGNTGFDVSRICLGCMGYGDVSTGFHQWVVDEEKSREVIKLDLRMMIWIISKKCINFIS